MAFLRNLLATLVGLLLFSIVGIFMFFAIITAASTDDVIKVKEGSVLYFNMSGMLADKAVEDPFLEAISNGPIQHSLLDIVAAIKKAKTDSRIKGLYIEPLYLAAGYASLQEIRDAILDFKESGKFVYAYGEYLSESDYYVASVADSVFVNPTGAIEFNGLSANVTFYKGLFEKLDIEPEVFRVGAFKSYVEPYVRKDMSGENRLQYSSLLLSMYDTYLKNVSESTGKTIGELNEISNLMKVRLPRDAKDLGLIHKVGYEDELKSVMKDRMGLAADGKIPFIDIKDYGQAIESELAYSSNRVAIIVAQGDIVMGGNEGIVGETFANEIRKARENSAIKAIVIRVNSGGGSMTASDMIWRELMLTKGKKPIIASMANAAASGGYYIAMAADTIIAQPNTITGSIGIFGLWLNFTDFLENKVGITHDVVKTGEYSDIYTVTRKLNSYERQIIQGTVEEGYETFTKKVAESRGMSQDDVKEIAEGRVWSGEQAVENGLVDRLGSFDDAVRMAVDMAGIEGDYRLAYYPEQKPFLEEFFDRMSTTVEAKIFSTPIDPILNQVNQLKKLQGIQARMSGDLEIR
ncbi:MAG: signal peptide peptidase SppA [Cyclobacteriaceae bacterium]